MRFLMTLCGWTSTGRSRCGVTAHTPACRRRSSGSSGRWRHSSCHRNSSRSWHKKQTVSTGAVSDICTSKCCHLIRRHAAVSWSAKAQSLGLCSSIVLFDAFCEACQAAMAHVTLLCATRAAVAAGAAACLYHKPGACTPLLCCMPVMLYSAGDAVLQNGQQPLMNADAAAAAAGDHDYGPDHQMDDDGMYSDAGADGELGDGDAGEGDGEGGGEDDEDADYNVTEQGL